MKSASRALVLALAAAALVLALSACGEKTDQTSPSGAKRPLTVMLDYLPNADHVGLYQGLASGEFANAGLDVKLQTPSDPSAPLKLVQAGKVDLAISYEPELLLARDAGAKLVSVAAIAQQPLTSIISIGKKGVTKPAQLRGKRVGTAGIPYQHAYLDTILQQAGVPVSSVKETNVGFNLVPAMLSGKVDATLGAYWNVEGIQLERAKKHPHVIRMEQVGVPTYDELVLVASSRFLADRGDEVRAFVQALGRGYAQARTSPETATDALVKANPDLDRSLALASVRASLPVFFPKDTTKPFGWQAAAEWKAYSSWMFQQRLVSRLPNAAAITNEFLPGQGS
jgi:putative hydroxymethylpyrimidine transport system substrate-binding protein